MEKQLTWPVFNDLRHADILLNVDGPEDVDRTVDVLNVVLAALLMSSLLTMTMFEMILLW